MRSSMEVKNEDDDFAGRCRFGQEAEQMSDLGAGD